MRTHRAHILLPEDLLREIDALVGARGRSAFLLETARAEVRRRKLLQVLESNVPFWDDNKHPELKGGADAWIHDMRQADEISRKHLAKPPARVRPKRRSRAG